MHVWRMQIAQILRAATGACVQLDIVEMVWSIVRVSPCKCTFIIN